MSNETEKKRKPGFEDEQSEFEHTRRLARGPKEVLRARPVKGEVDHNALTREIVARFPKILAALAK